MERSLTLNTLSLFPKTKKNIRDEMKMTTVHCWDEYSHEEQQKIIEESQLMQTLSDYLEAAITLQPGWQVTYVFIDPTQKTLGCKSFLVSYLLQKAGLSNIRVSRQQYNLIETEEYTYTQVKEALSIIPEHPEWIKEFKEEYKNNKTLNRFTWEMTIEELRNYL